MDDKHIMAGANCKRALQNKSGERKRRRTNATFSSFPLEGDETVNKFIKTTTTTTTSLRQTRQTAQKYPITAASFAKANNKSEKQMRVNTTPISRKLLRSSTQNPAEDHEGDDNYDEQPLDYGELEKRRNTLTEFSISLRETDQTNFQKELEHVEMSNKLYLANAKCDLKTKKIIHNKDADDDEMPENQECDDLAVEEQDDQELDEHSEDEQQQHDMQEQPIKQNVPKEKEKKVGCNKLNSFGNIISTLVSRPVFNKATLSPLSYLEIQSKYQCAPTEQKESRVNDQSDHYVINKLESLKDADEKQDLNKQQLDKTNTISNSVEKEESEDNNKTELYMEDIVEISKQDRERKIKNMVLSIAYPTQTLPLIANLTLEKHENSSEIPRQLHFKSFDDYNKEEEKYENELSSNNSSLSSDTSTTSSCKTTSEDNEAFHNGCKFRLKIKTQQKHQQVIKPASSVCNTQHPPSTNFGSSVSQNKHREQCNINNSNNNSTDVNYGCAIKSPTCSASTPTTANISHPSPITEQQTFISDPAVNNTTLNIDSHCVNKDNAEISPLPEKNTAAVADKCISSTQNPHIEKEPTDSNPNPNINTCEQTPHIDNRLDDGKINSRINCKADSDNENLQRENNIVEKEQGEENNLELNRKDEQDQDFDKYLGSSQVQHTEFEMEHQQHEKDIIDAADKVYTHIEQQQQQQQYHQHVTSSYEHIISHQHSSQQQQQHHHHDHHQQRNDIELQQQEHLALIQSQQQHSMQQHYASEQLYQLQQEQQLHIQQQLLIQHQQDQQQRHDLSQNQTTDQRQQQNSNMMDFLHPQQHHPTSNTHSPLHQQHQQIHEVYHDLMMDEFHDDHNTPYKLSLSPSNVKHENQDDGYETSAGDVLTPKSHASSSHSVTPQHHVQHLTSGLLINTLKSEDHQQHKQLHLQQQQQLHINTQNVQQEVSANDLATNNASRDPYHFIGDDLNNGGNNSLRNIQTPPHSHTHGNAEPSNPGNFMVMQSDGSTADMTPTNELFCISNLATDQHAQQTQQSCTNLSSEMTHVKHQRPHFSSATIDISGPNQYSMLNLQAKPPQKRRGRKKKIMEVLPSTLESSNPNDVNVVVERSAKTRKKHDRFNGMSEEEVVKRTLPDHLCDNLDIVIIGINPGLLAAYKGHHYAGPGNHFWKCLYLSGLTQDQMSADEDFKLINYGIGFTNTVQRATKGSADLTRKEIKEGSRILLEKLQRFRPKIAVFNGKLIFEVFSGKKDFNFGRQPECVEGTDTFIWVMPSSSARCAQLPRAADKVPFYVALKKFRDYLKGVIPHIDEAECVFTEERIKLQCEQVNFKNHQNSTNSNKETYANTDGISNNESLLQNSSGYPFDTETSSHGAAGADGTGTPGNGCSASFMMSSLVGGQQEKKKRGRPKKITGQEIIDPVTGNKIQVNNQLQSHGGDYTNILNLSIVQGGNCEMPKKKRGRPKKVKPQPTQLDILGQQDTQSSILTKKPNIMSIQAMTGDITQDSPLRQHADLQTNHQHVSTLYSTPPYQRSLYSPMASPMASPSLNCSYTTNTPPSQPHHDKLGIGGNMREDVKTNSTDLVQSNHHQLSDQNLGESPPPSSPNICTVDFDPPAAASIAPSSNVNDRADTELNVIHQRLQNTHQRSRYNSPIHTEVTTDHNTTEHFQHWLSSQHNPIHSPASAATTAVFANSPQQQSSLHYHEQQQMQSLQQQQHQELHAQWPLRHQRHYEDAATSHYMPNSPQLHHTHTHHHDQNQNQNQHAGSDVARKSLSGLESLVDQIPKISESESVALSSAAAMTAQAAAAAAVESRLQGMRNDPQVSDSHFVNTTTIPNNLTASNSPTASGNSNNNQHQQTSCSNNLLSSNFSVSNLAASSASSNIINNHESYGLAANTRPPTNPNTYHHSNLMAAAVMAAASANTPTNLSTSTAASATAAHHAQMYMDPHAHLTTHVPVNSLYSPPNSHHHPATAAHHAAAAHHHAAAAAAHYGNAQHTAAGYANNPYAAAAQSNVNAAHTLHMPSPNYPYGYATAASQSSYSGYPHSHTSHHVHPHGHHTSHHLTMFDRLKPSDIGGYSGF